MTSAEKKLDLWKNTLLDLTLRNPFLNMKRALSVPITLTSPNLCEITGERSFTLLSADSNANPSDTTEGQLCSVLANNELAKTIKKLCRTYKNNSREIGAHTLYLAVGTLVWTKSNDDTVYHAPLILVPADISRKGRSSYSLTFRFEEPSVNITLIQFIKCEYGLDIIDTPLYSAEDILRYIEEFKKAVSSIKGWSVSERCCIGIFSFANIAIWNDLCVRGAKILEHKLVKSIISGCPWKEDTSEECGTPCVYLPLPVDSSQKAAIESAAKGESFVLHGPPGTGKTNFLCNVAASQMGNGRSTLIASEKSAALEVVHERLEKLGLSPFSLLITPQTTTKQVLHHLEQALNLQPRESSSPANYAKATARFESLCEKADAYIKFINEKREQFGGMTMRELIEAYEGVKNAPDVYLSLHNATPQAKAQQEAAISALVKADCPPLGNLRGTDFFNLDADICRRKLPKAVAGYKAALYAFSNAINTFSSALDICPSSRTQIKETIELARAISFLGELPIGWLKHLDNNEYFAGVYETCKHFKESADIRLELEELWLPSFLEIDVEFTLKSYYSILRMPLIIRHIELLRLAKDLRPYSRNGYVLTSDIEESLKLLKEYRSHRSVAEKLLEVYSVDESDESYAAIIEKLETIHEYKELVGDKLEFVASIDGSMVKVLLAAWRELIIEKQRFYVVWDVPESISDEPCWIENQLRLCDSLDDTDAVGRFIDAAKGMLRVNLGNLFDEYALGKVEAADLLPIYKKQLYKCWIDTAFLSNSDFNHFSYEEVLDHISRQSAQLRLSACEEVYNHAVGRIAEFKESNPSEVTLLRKAILKSGRGLSIRELLSMIPTLVQVLYPCILCSPSAAAKHLPADMTFDTVITDESSQLRTSRAVGIISRGKNVVISGDEKQLPPTSFFEPRYDDSDLRLEEMDMDNILEDFLVLGPHEHYLKFHYRSCSQLIGFANHSFYNDGLITVPSASIKPVTSLVKANGVYERQRNGAEVAAAVKEVIHRYQVKDTRTIGIICMNIQQQAYITEMLDIARENDPRFDKWLDEAKEPLFIKNLETVQGDERDTLLISFGFGPDSNGIINQSMFGPLNHQHGWRRLNTAITRARKEVIVISSLAPEDIQINASTSRGVNAYRDFLLYASEGDFHGNTAAPAYSASHIRDNICTELTGLGFRTAMDVGSGAFRVDIAVTHPAAGDEYSVAVLIGDGRISVIDALTVSNMLVENGWKSVKIITPEAWYSNPGEQIDQIIKCFGDHYYAIRKGIKCCTE